MPPLQVSALSQAAFAPYGDVLEVLGDPDKLINKALCKRYHDRAILRADDQGRMGVSIFMSQSFSLPHVVDMLERHPLGSQAFIPMHQNPFLVIVAPDNQGQPDTPLSQMEHRQ
jgi:ureidoglycolate lyase